jgi:hypothetical protein
LLLSIITRRLSFGGRSQSIVTRLLSFGGGRYQSIITRLVAFGGRCGGVLRGALSGVNHFLLSIALEGSAANTMRLNPNKDFYELKHHTDM